MATQHGVQKQKQKRHSKKEIEDKPKKRFGKDRAC